MAVICNTIYKKSLRYKCVFYTSLYIPSYFSSAAFFPLHLKLIIRLLLCHSSVPSHLLPASIEKTGMFCKGTKAGWHYLAGVLWCSSPLEKQPRKVSFWDQKSSWFMAFDASCLLTKTHRFDIIQTDYFQEKKYMIHLSFILTF